MFGGSTPNAATTAPAVTPSSTADGEKRGFAQKMLEKMGWKHGEGLGRDKQGILAPLVARKTDKRSGVIIQGREQPKTTTKQQQQHQQVLQTLQQQQQQQQQQLVLPPNASRIVLLTVCVYKIKIIKLYEGLYFLLKVFSNILIIIV